MRVFSGIQPTGTPHLGNYFGALANWVKLQNEGHECFFCIVDQHAITTSHDSKKLHQNIIELRRLSRHAMFCFTEKPVRQSQKTSTE